MAVFGSLGEWADSAHSPRDPKTVIEYDVFTCNITVAGTSN